MRRYSAKYGKEVKRMSAAARDAMLAYSWPGNVRELSHVIERAVLWSQGGVLEVEQLSLRSNVDAASRCGRERRRATPLPARSRRAEPISRSGRSR